MKTCILAVQRYENLKDIDEWVNYHLHLCFDQIFLLDNNDENDPINYNHEKVVILSVNDIKAEVGDSIWQCEAYNRGFNYIKELKKYDWVAVIDIDEFIYLKKHANIQDFIQKECINKGLTNIELLWQLYNDNNILYHKDSFDGHILDTYKCYFNPNVNFANTIYEFKNMKYFTKFIGKITPELQYSTSPHYPAKELYDNHIYNWNLCDTNIAVLKHYKYKSLEDFISGKCKYRNYNKSIHGSTWKYARTYFEDNSISIDKLLAFAMLEFKYDLQMEEWDIEYLKQLFKRNTNKENNIYFINFTEELNNGNNTLLNYSEDFNIIELNEFNLHIDTCPYVRFMYDHKLYNRCKEFFECFLLYYFGGIYINDLSYANLINYFNNNEYMIFVKDNIIVSDIMMSKSLFNKILLDVINYCKTFSYDELNELYKEDNDMNMFLLNNLFIYTVAKNDINIKHVSNINYQNDNNNTLACLILYDL